MDPSRDMSQNGAPENPCLSTENDIERYFDFDSYYGSSKSPSDRHSLSSPRANRSTSPDSYLDYKFHHQDFSSPTEYYSSTWDQDFDYPVHEMSRYSTSDDGASVSGYSGHSPPELVRGGSTSPSEHSSPYYSDRPDSPPQVAALREAQIHDDEWIPHPRQDSHSPKSPSHGYPHEHHAAREHHRSKRTEDQSASLKRRRSGDTLEKRHRHLVDPSQTADVRRSGACIPCRVSKTRVRHLPHEIFPLEMRLSLVPSSATKTVSVPRADKHSLNIRPWPAFASHHPVSIPWPRAFQVCTHPLTRDRYLLGHLFANTSM